MYLCYSSCFRLCAGNTREGPRVIKGCKTETPVGTAQRQGVSVKTGQIQGMYSAKTMWKYMCVPVVLLLLLLLSKWGECCRHRRIFGDDVGDNNGNVDVDHEIKSYVIHSHFDQILNVEVADIALPQNLTIASFCGIE